MNFTVHTDKYILSYYSHGKCGNSALTQKLITNNIIIWYKYIL